MTYMRRYIQGIIFSGGLPERTRRKMKPIVQPSNGETRQIDPHNVICDEHRLWANRWILKYTILSTNNQEKPHIESPKMSQKSSGRGGIYLKQAKNLNVADTTWEPTYINILNTNRGDRLRRGIIYHKSIFPAVTVTKSNGPHT